MNSFPPTTLTQSFPQGLVNIDAELTKAEKKITAARAGIDKYQKVVDKAETPAEVKASSADSMKVLEAELAALQLSVQQFNRMRD